MSDDAADHEPEEPVCTGDGDPDEALHHAVWTLRRYGNAADRDIGRDAGIWLARPPGHGRSLDADLHFLPGWRSRRARHERDLALLRLRREHFAHLSGRAAARAVTIRLTRYETTSWLRDRYHARPGGLRGGLFDILALGGRVGEEALRKLFDAAG